MSSVDTSNFNSQQFVICNVAIGGLYCAVAMKYQLLTQTTLKIQMGALAISGLMLDHRFTTKKEGQTYLSGMSSLLVIGGVTVLTKELWKIKGMSAAVLTLSQLGGAQLCQKTKNPFPVNKDDEGPLEKRGESEGSLDEGPLEGQRNKPSSESKSREIGLEISVEELYQDVSYVRGFDKLVQEAWLAEKIEELCGTRAYFVGRITDESCTLLDLPKLFAKNPHPRTLPSVMLVNHNQHFSVVVYHPKDQKVRCFNSLSDIVNPLEKQVTNAMKGYFLVTGNLRNQCCPQKGTKGEGWSCAFQVLYFLEGFLRGDTLVQIDASPQPKKEVARRFSSYFSFLKAKQVEIPEKYQFFYDSVLGDKSLQGLADLLTTQCSNGWKAEDQSDQKEATRCSKRVECILIKLWELREQDDQVFTSFIQQLNLQKTQRRFLYKTLTKIEWSREAITNLFLATYLQVKEETVFPD